MTLRIGTEVRDTLASGGAVVALESTGDKEVLAKLAREIAMHVASANPQAMDAAGLDPAVVESAVAHALESARAAGVRGAAVTPFLLAAVERETGGRSLATNLALLESNAALAAEIAVALH